MLERKDLQAIRAIMNDMKEELKGELANSENLILQEVDRVQENVEKQIEQVEKNMDDLKQYYKITKLENDNTSLFLQMIVGLRKEVDELWEKIA